MNRAAGSVLSFALALTLALFVGIQTAGAVDGKDYAVFRVSECTPGEGYFLMLTERGVGTAGLHDGDLFYHVDQLTADASEMLVAVVFPDFTSCDAYVGGVFSDGSASPRKLGTYRASRMPDQLAAIGDGAFMGSAFTHVILGERVTSIGHNAFADCPKLTYVYLPDSVTSIENDAFAGSDKVVIGCSSGSKAKEFAENNGISCKVLP